MFKNTIPIQGFQSHGKVENAWDCHIDLGRDHNHVVIKTSLL